MRIETHPLGCYQKKKVCIQTRFSKADGDVLKMWRKTMLKAPISEKQITKPLGFDNEINKTKRKKKKLT